MLGDRVIAGPPRPSRILRPGAPVPGVERHVVPGGGAVRVAVAPGDRLELRDLEGGQPCEVIPLAPDGASDPGLLGVPPDGPATAMPGQVLRGIAAGGLRAIRLFGGRAGERAAFTAARPGGVIVAAPGGPMAIDGHDTATPVELRVTRTAWRGLRHDLPDPLADPVLDLRIGSATAAAYAVRAGDYIQIIDVDGRQCTDFQCFAARKVDRGMALPLDVTTTRTLMGASYPMPGLHSKYYDQDMDVLVEVVQDTCGRHDAFALACAAKYYDDIGYPGHVNCSDNFNAALAPRGVGARAGWMAINFFFNTAIDAHGLVVSDEPWSRPGDYVLMRAATDLICVSSACPDDTTPANGWDLTDIHVRTYDGARRFSRAVAWRATPESEPAMTAETAFHDRLAPMTRDFVPYKGYWLANSYAATGPVAEYWACRERAVVMDLSALRKCEVTGPDAEALLQYCLTRDVARLAVGQVVYCAMCYPHGGMVDDGTLLRLGPTNFRWIGGSDLGPLWLREQAAALGLVVLVRGSTDQMHNIAVQGPLSREILADVIWTAPVQPAIADLGWFRFAVARIGGPQGVPLVVSRTGYTGELGYELWCHPRDAGAVFDAVWAAGQPRGMVPMGLAALDMLRIEAGLIFAGHEFSDQTDPFEAGIGFAVPLATKPCDFIGRDALIARAAAPRARLVGLEVDAGVAVGHGDGVYVGRAQVGVVTSGMRSPLLGRTIALARVDVTHAGMATEVEVGKLDGQQKRLPARVVAFPHYDPQKTRVRA